MKEIDVSNITPIIEVYIWYIFWNIVLTYKVCTIKSFDLTSSTFLSTRAFSRMDYSLSYTIYYRSYSHHFLNQRSIAAYTAIRNRDFMTGRKRFFLRKKRKRCCAYRFLLILTALWCSSWNKDHTANFFLLKKVYCWFYTTFNSRFCYCCRCVCFFYFVEAEITSFDAFPPLQVLLCNLFYLRRVCT
jgi:hypothetical protein